MLIRKHGRYKRGKAVLHAGNIHNVGSPHEPICVCGEIFFVLLPLPTKELHNNRLR